MNTTSPRRAIHGTTIHGTRYAVSRLLPTGASLVALAVSLIFTLLMAASLAQPAAAAATLRGTLTLLPATAASSVSNDWAGYATSGKTYTGVSGSWTQPSVTCSGGPDSYAAFWVGLDGYSTRTVEQIGTDSDCSQAVPTYYAWYEMFPAYPVTLSRPVAAGDAISASVTSNGAGAFTLTISDATQHWTYITHQTSSAARLGSAEWITEAPSNGRRTLPLADFGSVTFTACTANGASVASSPNVDEIVLGAPYVGVVAQPSALSESGTSFSVMAGSSATGSSTTSPAPTEPTQPYPWQHHHHQHDSTYGGWSSGYRL